MKKDLESLSFVVTVLHTLEESIQGRVSAIGAHGEHCQAKPIAAHKG
jgi:hypothetical protein